MSKKIALVLDTWDFPYNGMVVSNKRFMESLTEQGYEFVIFVLGDDQPGRVGFKNLSLPGFNQILHKMKSPFALPNKKKIKQALQGVDVLSVQYPFFLGGAAITVAKEMGIPVVCSFHVQPENILRNVHVKSNFLVNLIYRLFNKYFYNRADVVIAPSPFAADLLIKHGVDRPIEVISNGVPDTFLQQPKTILDEQEFFTLLSVGRFAKEKHQMLIIDAVEQSKYAERITLVLVGAGPQEDNLRKAAANHKIAIQVGNVSHKELLELYQHSDLFVHASEAELEGMSVLEAMGAGLPVVIADAEGSAAKDLVVNEQSLFSFPSKDDLTAKIDAFLGDVDMRRQAQKDNYQRALEYSHKRSSDKFSALYTRLIDQKRA